MFYITCTSGNYACYFMTVNRHVTFQHKKMAEACVSGIVILVT